MANSRFGATVAGKTKNSVDFSYMLTVFIMLAFGLIMVFSASTAVSVRFHGNSWTIFLQQATWIGIGLVVMFLLMNIDYKILGRFARIGIFVTLILHIVVLIPGVGITVNEATRWLGIGEAFSFQPSELAKIALILFFARQLSLAPSRVKTIKGFVFPYLTLIGVIGGLLYFQPHFSALLLISVTLLFMLFVAGAKIKYFVFLSIPAIAGIVAMIVAAPYRIARIVAFLDPFADLHGGGWQAAQSLLAIGSGGFFGVGLGQSRQKFDFLPEPHNDFIFSVIAEELGFIGVILVICLFIFIIKRGIRIAMNAPDSFGTFLAVGITALIGFQAVINIAVVTASMPVTGMPLPFFSYGGSAMVFTMAAMGIMLNISRQSTMQL